MSLELLLIQSDFRVNGGRWSRDMGDMIERIHARLSTGQQSLHGHNMARVVRFAARSRWRYQKQSNRRVPMAVVWLPTRGPTIAAMPRKAKEGKLNIEITCTYT